MRLLHSLRWRFQLFYGLLLLAVLVAFGLTAYALQRAQVFREVDDDLRARLSVMANRMAPPPPRERPDGPRDRPDGARRDGFPRGDREGPPRGDREVTPRGGDRVGDDQGDRDGEPRGDREGGPRERRDGDQRDPRRGDGPERFREGPPREGPPPMRDGFRRRSGPPDGMSPRDLAQGRAELLREIREGDPFVPGTRDALYAAIWLRNGHALTQTPDAPAGIPRPSAGAEKIRQRGTLREATMVTAPGDALLAGRDIALTLAELKRFGWLLAGASAGVLVLVLLGGWWMAGRALRPIGEISAAAVKIAGGDLSERIGAAKSAGELGELAAVLNSTFARLEAAFAQQARFTSDAAHELRTPVAVILSQVQSALARERPAEEYREALEASQRAAQRMRRLIESLLQLARLDAGEESLPKTDFDLADAARECGELLQPLALERGVTLVPDVRTTPARGNADRLAQVVTNLVTNAIQHTPPGGSVVLTCAPQNGHATVTVSDSGLGIAAQDLPHLFERFYRADKSRSRPDGRTGLGLAISKAIVDAHGGTLEVATSAAGSVFTLRVPAGQLSLADTRDEVLALSDGERTAAEA